jgi:hypothetical protein
MDKVILGYVMPNQRLERAGMPGLDGPARGRSSSPLDVPGEAPGPTGLLGGSNDLWRSRNSLQQERRRG